MIILPEDVKAIIKKMKDNHFDAYVVGGCVRDSLLGISPKDWDICTSALPEEIERVFSEEKVIETGIKHGTVTVMIDDVGYEITTFRSDGEYSDHRRPDHVNFVSDVKEDLSRRDFTINAMAYNDEEGLIDPFSGQTDLKEGVIRCVGDPNVRFEEDALRIMRALRFSSVFGFAIDKNTAKAMRTKKLLLNEIAVERIRGELCKLLAGKNVLFVLSVFQEIISVVLPEIVPCVGFAQNNKYHSYTVYGHIVHAVANYHGTDPVVNFALLLHDIGKPYCYTKDENGKGHFYGHAVPSAEIAKKVVQRMKFDKKSQDEIVLLVSIHDDQFEPTTKNVRKWLNKIGPESLLKFIEIKRADMLAHTPGTQEERLKKLDEFKGLMEEELEAANCFSLKDLAISGRDVMELGIPEGKQVGQLLNIALDKVMQNAIANERDDILNYLSFFVNSLDQHKKYFQRV